MTEATQTLAQLKKTSKLTRLAFHKNGPKSFRRGQGALLNALLENDGATQRELVHVLGFDRGELKGCLLYTSRPPTSCLNILVSCSFSRYAGATWSSGATGSSAAVPLVASAVWPSSPRGWRRRSSA